MGLNPVQLKIIELVSSIENERDLQEVVEFVAAKSYSHDEEEHLTEEQEQRHAKSIDDALSGRHEKFKDWDQIKHKYDKWL